MIVVLDSSVLIAAYISRAGVCAQLLEDVYARHQLVASDYIIEEVARKLTMKFKFSDELVLRVKESITTASLIVTPAVLNPDQCRDAADLPVLGTGVAGDAQLLITVDKDLLELKTFGNFAIIKPGEFWKQQL